MRKFIIFYNDKGAEFTTTKEETFLYFRNRKSFRVLGVIILVELRPTAAGGLSLLGGHTKPNTPPTGLRVPCGTSY